MSNLVEGGHGFFNFFKGGHVQKSLGNPALERSKTINNGKYGYHSLSFSKSSDCKNL